VILATRIAVAGAIADKPACRSTELVLPSGLAEVLSKGRPDASYQQGSAEENRNKRLLGHRSSLTAEPRGSISKRRRLIALRGYSVSPFR
jgi:hypothetical protein